MLGTIRGDDVELPPAGEMHIEGARRLMSKERREGCRPRF